jgi:hypothetical protein
MSRCVTWQIENKRVTYGYFHGYEAIPNLKIRVWWLPVGIKMYPFCVHVGTVTTGTYGQIAILDERMPNFSGFTSLFYR